MSDESGQGEQPQEQASKWGDPISEDRQAELDTLAEQQRTWAKQPEATRGESPLSDVRLTGADVFWLAKRTWADPNGSAPHLEGADLIGAHLERANLGEAHLGDANLNGAQLEGADLIGAHLEGTQLNGAQLARANLTAAQLERADLSTAYLQGADLHWAQLAGASLNYAQLAGARFTRAHLDGADLSTAYLQGADLTGVFLDAATDVSTAAWTAPKETVGPQLADVHWGGVNLTAVDWERITTLRDEQLAEQRRDTAQAGKPMKKGRQTRIDEYKAAGRAYRLLFVTLRSQGLTAPATRYHYRAEIMDRKALWHAHQFGRWLFSWLLGTFAGYGDRLGRLFATYGITVSLFALAMLGVALGTGSHLSLDTIRDTLVLSVTSFHGRGVQPPGLHLSDTLATLAGLEAVFGLLIEGLFIAAFTRRVTGG